MNRHLLDSPEDIPSLSGLIQREIIYRILRGPEGARLRAAATLGDQSQQQLKSILTCQALLSAPAISRGQVRNPPPL